MNKLIGEENKKILIKIFKIVLFWHILVSVVMIVSVIAMGQKGPDLPLSNYNNILQPFIHWDARYFIGIALKGYGLQPSGLPAFFPLFPLILRASSFFSVNVVLWGLLVNFIASFGAVYFLYKLAYDYLKNKELAYKAVDIFIFFPTAFFLCVLYTEAIFCFLCFGAFYFAKKRNWLVSNIFIAFATASRLVGVVLAVAIFIEYLSSIKFKFKNIKTDILYFLIAPFGLILYSIYLHYAFDDFLFFKNAYKYGWTERNAFKPNVFESIYKQSIYFVGLFMKRPEGWTYVLYNQSIGYFAWLGAFYIGVKSLKKIPYSYTFFIFANLFIILSQGIFDSIGRYIIVLFPIFIFLAKYFENKPIKYNYYILTSASVMILFAILFANGFWIG